MRPRDLGAEARRLDGLVGDEAAAVFRDGSGHGALLLRRKRARSMISAAIPA